VKVTAADAAAGYRAPRAHNIGNVVIIIIIIIIIAVTALYYYFSASLNHYNDDE